MKFRQLQIVFLGSSCHTRGNYFVPTRNMLEFQRRQCRKGSDKERKVHERMELKVREFDMSHIRECAAIKRTGVGMKLGLRMAVWPLENEGIHIGEYALTCQS